MTISWSYQVEASAESATSPTELALDPETWDLALPIRWIRGAEAIAQRILVRLRWFKGEWFLDENQGIPYFQVLLGVKSPDIALVSGLLRRAILSTPGVARVQSLDLSYDSSTREASLAFVAETDDGAILTYASDSPLVLPYQGGS